MPLEGKSILDAGAGRGGLGCGHRGLAAELDAALIVDDDDLDLDHVADLHDVGHALDVAVGEFGDVAHAVGAGGELDERAEVLDADDLAGVDRADLDLLAEGLDLGAGLLDRFAVGRGDV